MGRSNAIRVTITALVQAIAPAQPSLVVRTRRAAPEPVPVPRQRTAPALNRFNAVAPVAVRVSIAGREATADAGVADVRKPSALYE